MEHNYRYPPPQRFPSTAPVPYTQQPHAPPYPPPYPNVPPRPNFEYNYPPPAYQRMVQPQPYYGYEYSSPNLPPSTPFANNFYYNQFPNTNVPPYDSQSHAIKPYEDCNDYSKALNDYKKDSDEYKKTLDRKHKEHKESRHSNERTYNDRRSSRSYSNRSRSRSRSRRPHYGYRRSRSRSRSRGRNRSSSHFRKYTRPVESYKNSRPAPFKGRENNSIKGRDKKPLSERETLLAQWRKNYCATSEEMTSKLEELSKYTQEETIEREKSIWTRTTPADLFYARDDENPKIIRGTSKLAEICDNFYEELVLRAEKINALKPKYEPPQRRKKTRLCKHKSEQCSEDSDSTSEDFSEDEEENIMEELTRKQQHPDRLHPEMWYNDPGEMNDGPLCRCSLKSRKSGIRHGIYAGEKFLKVCDKNTNNSDKLYHYRITISPPTNFLTKTPTIIKHDEHEFIFEGFSMFSHFPLIELPTCKVIRFNIEYTILYIEEKHPDNFTIKELDLFHDYLFRELLELVDLDFRAAGDINGCSQFHFMPRFVRDLPDNGREILSMKEVLQYLLDNSKRLIKDTDLSLMVKMSQYEWQSLADEVKGMVVTYPGKKPCSVRVDQLDRNSDLQIPDKPRFPDIVHFGIRPPQLSYAGNPEYQKAWRDYVKFRHLLANMSKPTFEDKRKLEAKEIKLQEMRTQSKMKRDVTVAVTAEGFYRTGIMCDIIQHAMLIPVLVCHLRFHHSLNVLEENIDYKFRNRALLQLALTHPSYRENFGTNPDHARNSLTNCGIRQPEYGDRRIHYMNTRKRGINTLINIMSRFGKKYETESNITHNERLEFLGDAVVEFLSSIHLFRMFPDLEEGGLATYRAAIVQNQHLAVLARTLYLDQFMLYAHGSDLCHDLELRHAMANCFEALMGALFLDGGIEVADKVFGSTLFKIDPNLLEVWENLPSHPLQEQEPTGDRQWIPNFELLQKLTKFEESIGVEFKHIRLLARAFTDRSIGYTNLTLGSNQRLEFLGDTVLQLIASEYLYKYFPEHHEGHLSLLRSSLVNNRTQAVVCDDLGMANYAVYNNPKAELKTKDRADLLEAFVGALYIDKGLEYCRVFCQVTLFPRLQDFIMNQDWNDPKSKLQQCCLTLRTMDGGEPDIPVYKVIECKGPTNTRVYTVAVYFRGRRLAKATGHSIQQAEMNSAKKALEISHDLFPQLDHQKRVIAKSMKKQKYPNKSRKHSLSSSDDESRDSSQTFNKRLKSDTNPKQYRGASTSTYRSNSKESDYARSESRSTHRSISISKESKFYKYKSSQRSRSRSKTRSMSKSTDKPYQSKSDRSNSVEFKKNRDRSKSSSKERSTRRRSNSVEFKKNRERSKSSSKERSTRRSKSFDRRSNSNDSIDYKRYRERSLRSRSKSRSIKRSNSKEPMCYKSTSNRQSRDKSPSISRKSSRSKSREFSRSRSRSKAGSIDKSKRVSRSKSKSKSHSPRSRSRSSDSVKRAKSNESNKSSTSSSSSSSSSSSDSDV